MKLLSLRAYAKHRGVALRAVQRAIEDGRIKTVRDSKGKVAINPEEADRQWESSTDPSKQRSKASISSSEAYAASRAARENFNARIAQLDYEERAGKLIQADKVQAEWQKIITTAKTKFLSVPSKLRVRIPHLTLEDIATIEEEVRAALEELADTEAEPGEASDE